MMSMMLVFWLASSLLGFQPELSKEQSRFLDQEAQYIITDQERERFLALPTSSERDEFIERFWQIRDPVPETAVNEFKEEHFKRFREANEKYRESRPGWMTERGRMYITLGEPQDVMSYPNNFDLFPLQIWFYYNLDIPLFPNSLQLIFFKRNGAGEYRLFSPAFDGMKALIADPVKRGMIGFGNRIPVSASQNWDVDIVKAAESVGPGQNLLSSEAVLADLRTPGFVFEKTRRNLGAKVTAEASFGGELPLHFTVDYFRGEEDFSEAHLSLEIAATDLRVNQYDDRMLGRYDLIGTLTRVESGDVLEEFRDSLEIEIARADWETTRHFPVLFQRKVELLPGRYRLEMYVRDFVGRRLAIVDRMLVVPGFDPARVAISSFVAAFKADEGYDPAAGELPLQFGRLRLYPKPGRVFGEGQRVLAFMEVYYPVPANGPGADPGVSVRFTLKRGEEIVLDETNRFRPGSEAPGTVDVLKVISGPVLSPGAYQLEALVSEERSAFTDLARVDFEVGPAQEMGRHSAVGLSPELRPAQAHFSKAYQYLAAERYQDAVRLFKVALDYEPYFQEARRGKARAEILGGDAEAGEKTALEALARDEKDVDALALLGLARFRLGNLAGAAEAYRKAIAIGGEEVGILNALGETEYALGNKDAALQTLARSLELAPDQPEVRDFLQEVKRSP
jgi:GWxTD domain-containing protein